MKSSAPSGWPRGRGQRHRLVGPRLVAELKSASGVLLVDPVVRARRRRRACKTPGAGFAQLRCAATRTMPASAPIRAVGDEQRAARVALAVSCARRSACRRIGGADHRAGVERRRVQCGRCSARSAIGTSASCRRVGGVAAVAISPQPRIAPRVPGAQSVGLAGVDDARRLGSRRRGRGSARRRRSPARRGARSRRVDVVVGDRVVVGRSRSRSTSPSRTEAGVRRAYRRVVGHAARGGQELAASRPACRRRSRRCPGRRRVDPEEALRRVVALRRRARR